MALNELSLKDVIRCALNSVEAGGESKKEVVDQVVAYIESKYIEADKVKEVVPEYLMQKLCS